MLDCPFGLKWPLQTLPSNIGLKYKIAYPSCSSHNSFLELLINYNWVYLLEKGFFSLALFFFGGGRCILQWDGFSTLMALKGTWGTSLASVKLCHFLYFLCVAFVLKWTLCAALQSLFFLPFVACHWGGCLSREAGAVVQPHSVRFLVLWVFLPSGIAWLPCWRDGDAQGMSRDLILAGMQVLLLLG